MTLHTPSPVRHAVYIKYRLGAYRCGVKYHIRAHESHAAGAFRKPLIPAYTDADLSEAGVPDLEAGVAGREVEFFLIELIIRNVSFAVYAEYGAVCVYHCNAVVGVVPVTLKKAYRNYYAKLTTYGRKTLYRKVFFKRSC